MKYAGDLASCIWKALGFVLRLIHTDYTNYYHIAGDRKAGPKKLPAWGGGRSPPGKTGRTLGPPPVLTLLNFLKHLTDWLGVSTVESCGWKKRDLNWRDLEIYVRGQKWGGGWDPLLPPPWKVGGGASTPLPPPVPTPMGHIRDSLCNCK